MYSSDPHFHPDRVVFSFGVLSDWHIKADPEPERDNRDKLVSAISQLRETAARDDPRGLVLLIAAGDMTQDGQPAEIAMVRQTMERAMDWDKTAFLYVAGNHDKHAPDCNAVYREIFGETVDRLYDAQDAAPDGILSGNRHYVMGGHHFITMDLIKYHKQEPNTFTQSAKDWLDDTLRCITEREPNAYVFVITHLLMQDTCYGSSRGFFYATDDLLPILRKYPQVVTFGGHLHYPLNDERAIMQTEFTAMETATLSDMLVDGFDCANVRKGTKTEGNREFAQGLLVQIDDGGNLRVRRMDFWHRAEIGEPWMLDSPSADGAHLLRYTADRRLAAAKEPPALSGGMTVTCREEGDSRTVTLCFASARPLGSARSYAILLTDAESGAEVRRMEYLTDFYHYSSRDQTPAETEIPLPDMVAGRYGVSVAALDFWGNAGEPLCGEIEIP